MHRLTLIGAAVLAGASGLAIAQTTDPEPTPANQGISAQVTELAKGQRDAETKGIGKQVREIARNRTAGTEDGSDTGTDGTDAADDGDAAAGQGLGTQVRELAHNKDRETRGIGPQVRELARPAEVTEARAAAQAAREDARAAREQAREARRGGRGG